MSGWEVRQTAFKGEAYNIVLNTELKEKSIKSESKLVTEKGEGREIYD